MNGLLALGVWGYAFAPLARSAFGVLGYAFLADFTTDTHSPIPKSAPKSPKVWGYASLAAPKILIEVWGPRWEIHRVRSSYTLDRFVTCVLKMHTESWIPGQVTAGSQVRS